MIRVSVNRQASAGTAIAFARICSRSWCSRAFTALAMVLALPSLAVAQTNGTWTQTANGTYTWSNGANWSGGIVAGGTGSVTSLTADTASGGGPTTALQTINLNATVTTGTLRWADTNATGGVTSYGIAAGTGGALNMATSDGSTPTILYVGASQNQQMLISAPITGTQGLRISSTGSVGTGQVNLTGTSTFTGNITIDGAVTYFNLLDTGRLGATGTFAGDISIGTGAFFRPWNSGLQTLSGNISGAGGIQMIASAYNTGTLALTGSNAFTGTINVNGVVAGSATQGRVLRLGNADAMRNAILSTSTSALENAGTRTVQFATGIGTFNLGGIAAGSLGTGNIGLTDTASSAITLAVGHNNAASSYSGTFFGAGNLTKVGSGVLTLSAANTYSGTTTVSAGVLSISSTAALPGWNVGGRWSAASGAALVAGNSVTDSDFASLLASGNYAAGAATGFDTTSNRTYGSAIADTGAGALGLRKLGSGTLTLSASNSYTGTTAVNAGVLAMNNAAALGTGTVTFGGGTLQYGSGITADLSGRIASSGSAIAVDTGANNVTWATGLASTNTGGLTKLGSGTLTLSASNAYTGASTISAGRLVVGDVNALGSSTSALAVNGGTLDLDGRSISVGALSGSSGATITTSPAAGTATLTTTVNSTSTFAGSIADNGSGRVALTKTGNSGLTLTGTNTFTGDISVAGANLDLGTTGLLGSGSYGGNISISSAGGGQFRIMANANQTLSGTISGDGVLWMVTSGLGTGTTTLTAANTFTGQVLAGNQFSSSGFLVPTLQLGNGNALQSARLVVSASNKLVFSPGIGTFNVGSLEASGTLQGHLTLQDTSGAAITLSAGGNNLSTTYARVLSGSGNLTKVGSGTLTLSASNTYTGTTGVNGGVLAMNNAAGLGTTGTVTFGGGTLQYGSGITTDLSGRIAASGSAIAVDTGANNVTWATGLASTNTGGLTKLGSGALTLSAANNYSGGTTIRNGSVAVTSPANLGSGTIAITPDAGTGTPSLRLNNTVSGTYTQPITMSSINVSAYPAVDASSATAQVTLSGGITVSNNAFLARLVAPTGTTGSLVVDGNITGTGDLQLTGNGGAGVIQKDIDIGSAILNVGGAGSTWSIGGGAYTWGTTNIQLAGSALRTTADGVLPSSSALSFGGAAGALDINGTRQTVGSVGSSVAGSRIILGSGTLTVGNTNASSFAGVISGAGGGLVKTNSGTLTLSGSSTYSGATTIAAGRLVVGNAAALGASSAALAVNGGTLDLGGFSVGVGALSGSAGALITTATTAGTATLTSAVASGTSIFAGVIQDNGSGLVALTKSGAGVLDLLGANTYSGATSVSAGTLLVTGQLGNTAVTVDSGATLGGSGSIAGAVTVNGFLSPGTSPGVLRVGALTLGTSGTSLFEIDGLTRGSQYDGTDVTNALSYGGSLVIDFGSAITEAFGDNTIFNLFDFDSYTSAFTSITTASDASFYGGLTFTAVGAGDTWTATKDSQTLEFTHSTGELVIVPEPGAIALAAIGIAAAAWSRRRRK